MILLVSCKYLPWSVTASQRSCRLTAIMGKVVAIVPVPLESVSKTASDMLVSKRVRMTDNPQADKVIVGLQQEEHITSFCSQVRDERRACATYSPCLDRIAPYPAQQTGPLGEISSARSTYAMLHTKVWPSHVLLRCHLVPQRCVRSKEERS